MINNNVSFKGYTYAQGSSPRKEIEPSYIDYTDNDKAKIKKAITKNIDLVKQNSSSKLDISILPSYAMINFIPDDIDENERAHSVVVKSMEKGMFETLNSFVKRVLTYAIKNHSQLEKGIKEEDQDSLFYTKNTKRRASW